jgi:hypothetical protein
LDKGSEKAMLACTLPGVATGFVGAPGIVIGVTAFDATEATELPAALVAITVNAYEVPLVNPVTILGEVVPVLVKPPGEDVTVYPVITLPPLEAGATKATLA